MFRNVWRTTTTAVVGWLAFGVVVLAASSSEVDTPLDDDSPTIWESNTNDQFVPGPREKAEDSDQNVSTTRIGKQQQQQQQQEEDTPNFLRQRFDLSQKDKTKTSNGLLPLPRADVGSQEQEQPEHHPEEAMRRNQPPLLPIIASSNVPNSKYEIGVTGTRTIKSIPPGSEIVIDVIDAQDHCTIRDEYGDNECYFHWGDIAKANYTAKISQELEEGVYLQLDVLVDHILPWRFTCELCGDNPCVIKAPFFNFNYTFDVYPCPIKVGTYIPDPLLQYHLWHNPPVDILTRVDVRLQVFTGGGEEQLVDANAILYLK